MGTTPRLQPPPQGREAPACAPRATVSDTTRAPLQALTAQSDTPIASMGPVRDIEAANEPASNSDGAESLYGDRNGNMALRVDRRSYGHPPRGDLFERAYANVRGNS